MRLSRVYKLLIHVFIIHQIYTNDFYLLYKKKKKKLTVFIY